ncbi:DUF7097 family protein [Halovenus halobia]|uniref:DUF7097 family protein n=1 Tax=Halovenus halobia TaxID=3396622 RepID=UPI003F56F438
MEKTESGTSVGVDDPYRFVERCDHLTDEGKCRFAVEHGDRDRQFSSELRAEEFQCPVAGDTDEEGLTGPWDWQDCPHFRARETDDECIRCGLTEQRMAHDDERPLLEEHHLSYADSSDAGSGDPSHEITVSLCRWCHASVHDSWARIDDDASPDPEAIAQCETRKARQDEELSFETAAERYDPDNQ